MADKILVTGATGKVGQRLVPRLLSWREPGDEIRVLVRTAEAAVRFEAAGAQAVVGDVTDAEARKRALDGVSVVVNSAASFRAPKQGAEEMYAVNRDAAVALAREAVTAGVRRFVQISTNLVYGPGIGRPVREDDELRAEANEAYSAYPHSKREAEEQLRELSSESGLDVVTLRLAFVYGEGDPHITESLPRFANMAAHQPLAMVHHADVAQGVQRAIRTLRPGGGYTAYNIAGDMPSPVVELFALDGKEFDLDAAAGREVADPWFGVPDTTRAHRDLGFRPIYPTARAAWRDGTL
ncbi:MAG TPA: NAD(P)-dependent oxidoreductase [Actinospica sp.]|jgi:nucleoside-diphosphate-sugar epimerase|nr:NAD(P)-dependent oxidoreductase [Actinospica sp.]